MKSNVARATLADDDFVRVAKKLRSSNNDDNNGGGNGNIDNGLAKIQISRVKPTLKFGQSAAGEGTIRPALECMLSSVLIKILQYLPPDDFRRDVLAFEQTCRSFRNLLRDDDIWRKCGFRTQEFDYPLTQREQVYIPVSLRHIHKWQKGSDNIILHYLGGADGLRRVVGEMLQRMRRTSLPGENASLAFKCVLRGDTIAYITEVVEEHMLTRLEKAHCMAIQYCRSGNGCPEVTAKELRLLDVLAQIGGDRNSSSITSGWEELGDACCTDQIVGAEERRKLVRALAYRAGIVKLSGEAFSIIAREILHHVAALSVDAFEACIGVFTAQDKGNNKEEDEVEEQEDDSSDFRNDYTNYCPPFHIDNDDGKVRCVLIPRQIKDAAVRMDMKPLLGFGEFGVEWAASSDDKREEEIEEAEAEYYLEEDSSNREEEEPEVELDESSIISMFSMDSWDSPE